MKKFLLSTLLVFISILANAQTNPAITSWMRNTTNAVGYNNLPLSITTLVIIGHIGITNFKKIELPNMHLKD